MTDDRRHLRSLIRKESDAHQRDRFRAVVLAIEGRETGEIQRTLERSRGFVQRWAYAYREGGLEALRAKPRPGRNPKLPREKEAELIARLEGGPLPEDGVCTLRGRDIRRILEHSFGVRYSLNGVYELLSRLEYSCLVPRPRHQDNDPKTMEEFQRRAPLLSRP